MVRDFSTEEEKERLGHDPRRDKDDLAAGFEHPETTFYVDCPVCSSLVFKKLK